MLKYTIHLTNGQNVTASGYNASIAEGVLTVVDEDSEGRRIPRIVCAVPVANIIHVESAAE